MNNNSDSHLQVTSNLYDAENGVFIPTAYQDIIVASQQDIPENETQKSDLYNPKSHEMHSYFEEAFISSISLSAHLSEKPSVKLDRMILNIMKNIFQDIGLYKVTKTSMNS